MPKLQTALRLEDETARNLSNPDVSLLFQQAAIFLFAGVTPAITLTVACFNVLRSASIRSRLQTELNEFTSRMAGGVSNPQMDWRELNRLPYLVRCAYTLVLQDRQTFCRELANFWCRMPL